VQKKEAGKKTTQKKRQTKNPNPQKKKTPKHTIENFPKNGKKKAGDFLTTWKRESLAEGVEAGGGGKRFVRLYGKKRGRDKHRPKRSGGKGKNLKRRGFLYCREIPWMGESERGPNGEGVNDL